MSITPKRSRVVVLMKALPQSSKRYGETVCCAGVTAERKWQRLYPVRFRHLQGSGSFNRWDWIKFTYRRPTTDGRLESCHVFEDSIVVDGELPQRERTRLLTPMIMKSANHAAEMGYSLALIRPRNTRFWFKAKSKTEIDEEREAYQAAAKQTSMFDKELARLEPSPYEFKFDFDDDHGKHTIRMGIGNRTPCFG